MRKLRKPLSWLLAVCMLFSLLPGTALAADPDPAPVADTTTYTDGRTCSVWAEAPT